jgi:GT2 family glycosyltransferase
MMIPIDTDDSPPDASVIVVTHNNEALIDDCLRTIDAGLERYSHETIVVDNASIDRTLDRISAREIAVRVVALDRNMGFAAATNAGIEASRGRLVVLVNSDAFPDTGSIDRLIEAIDQLPQAAILGGRLRYPTGELQPSTGSFPSLLGGLWVALFLHRAPLISRLGIGIAAHAALYRKRRQVDWVTAAFCVARREASPLPARTFMYGEDVEWAFGCRQAGLEIWFDPAATAVHIGRASVDQHRERGFAQRQRAQFELEWFGRRGRFARFAARGVLASHALIRLAIIGPFAALRRDDGRAREYVELLRAAVTHASVRP